MFRIVSAALTSIGAIAIVATLANDERVIIAATIGWCFGWLGHYVGDSLDRIPR